MVADVGTGRTLKVREGTRSYQRELGSGREAYGKWVRSGKYIFRDSVEPVMESRVSAASTYRVREAGSWTRCTARRSPVNTRPVVRSIARLTSLPGFQNLARTENGKKKEV